MHSFVRAGGIALAAALACGDGSGSGPDPIAIPTPGPHFTHSPIPVESIARITPIGYNNKVFPVDHTYWLTCDIDIILQGSRPCVHAFQPLVAPGSGMVRGISTAADGFLSVEGPPGMQWTFGHVTPAPGLAVGSPVVAGQVVATMFYDHGFDFGLFHNGVTHVFTDSVRYHHAYIHAQNPIAQFPDSLRTLMLARVNSLSDPLGRMSYDVAGTASGGWFIAGSPRSSVPLQFGNEHMLLWLARYVEREATRIVSVGDMWPGMPNRLLAVDSAAPTWEAITPASGVVAIRLWNIGVDALPNTAWAGGTLLVHLMTPNSLRVEWFNTHAAVTAFTAAARTYER